jgi:hypothetical protein
MSEKYNRKDSVHLRVEPDVAGRIRFYRMALKARNKSQALNTIMDLAQERINEISREITACPPDRAPVPSHSLTNYEKIRINGEKESVEGALI